MKVYIRDSAFADLQQIHEWIKQDRPDAAIGVIERIFESLDHLVLFPFMGHPGQARRTFEWVVPGIPFIIIYEIDEPSEEVRVISVFHGHQNRDFE